MGICGAVASGMIAALTGIVFSLAFVMVQFSATAYSPRLVLWVGSDPVVSHALGIFSATFLYSLVMLGLVRPEWTRQGPDDQQLDGVCACWWRAWRFSLPSSIA